VGRPTLLFPIEQEDDIGSELNVAFLQRIKRREQCRALRRMLTESLATFGMRRKSA
jgi:hypothetical protein